METEEKKIKLQDKNREQNLEDLVTAWIWKMKREESNFTLRLLAWLIEWKILLTKIENRRGKRSGQWNEFGLETLPRSPHQENCSGSWVPNSETDCLGQGSLA